MVRSKAKPRPLFGLTGYYEYHDGSDDPGDDGGAGAGGGAVGRVVVAGAGGSCQGSCNRVLLGYRYTTEVIMCHVHSAISLRSTSLEVGCL